MNALVNEICHLALTSSIIAIKLHRQKKWTFENLKQDSSLVMQGVSSVTRLFFTAIDPLNENKRLQTLQQFILPITTIAKGRYTQDKWDPSPLISPILNWGIPYISSSKSLKTITTNFSPLIFNEVLTPSYQNSITKREFASNALYYLSHPNQEGISSGLSTLHSMTTHLALPYLEACSNLNHIQPSRASLTARILTVFLTNSALTAQITNVAAKKIKPLAPVEERQNLLEQKYEDLPDIFAKEGKEKAREAVNEITRLQHQLSGDGTNFQKDPKDLHDYVDKLQERFDQERATLNALKEERIQEIDQELSQQEGVIATGKEHAKNVGNDVEIIDDGIYHIKRKDGNWRVYRSGIEVFKAKGESSKDKKKCEQKIPKLKEKYGIKQPTQACIDANAALNAALHKQSNLQKERAFLQGEKELTQSPPMTDETLYHRLLSSKELLETQRAQELSALNKPDYSKHGTAEETKIKKLETYLKAEKKYEKIKHTNYPYPCGKAINKKKLEKAKKAYRVASKELKIVKEYITERHRKIALLDHKIREADTFLSQAQTPSLEHPESLRANARSTGVFDPQSVWIPPESTVPLIIDTRNEKKHHHLSFIKDGMHHTLGKYKNKEDADFIAASFSRLIAQNKSHEWECYQLQKHLLHQGVPAEKIPNRPDFECHALGGDSDSNYDTITHLFARNRISKDHYSASLQKIAQDHGIESLKPEPFSKLELKDLSASIQPTIRPDPKPHGFWFKLWRVPREIVRWLDKHGVQVSVYASVDVPLYTVAPSTGTSHAETLEQIAIETYHLQQLEQSAQAPPPSFQPNLSPYQPLFQPLSQFAPPPLTEPSLFPPIQLPSFAPTFHNQNPFPLASSSSTALIPVQKAPLKNIAATFFNAAANYFTQDPLLPNAPIRLGPQTELLFLPEKQVQKILPNFDPSLQTKYPEVYALAVQIDKLGREDIALLRVTLEEYEKQRKGSKLVKVAKTIGVQAMKIWHDPRFQGTLQVLGGAFEVGAGAGLATSTGGLAAPIAGAMAAHGSDQMIAGAKMIVTGKPQETLTVQLLQKTGLSQDTSHLIDGGLSMAGNLSKGLITSTANLNKGRALLKSAPLTIPKKIVTIEDCALKQLSDQRAFIGPAYRSSLAGERAALTYVEKNIKAITPLKLPPVQVGEELNWVSHNLPKIRELRELKGHRFDSYLKSTFKDQNLSETQIRRVLNYSGFNTYQRPLGLPNNVTVELSDKNGGMIYRLAGTTNKENLVVRVCPGLAKESMVVSVIEGNHLNGKLHGTLRQQTPYVIQRSNTHKLTIHGEWVDFSLSRNKHLEGLTHIPLEIYQFKGWGP